MATTELSSQINISIDIALKSISTGFFQNSLGSIITLNSTIYYTNNSTKGALEAAQSSLLSPNVIGFYGGIERDEIVTIDAYAEVNKLAHATSSLSYLPSFEKSDNLFNVGYVTYFQPEAMISLLLRYNWTEINIVYSSDYSNDLTRLRFLATTSGISVAAVVWEDFTSGSVNPIKLLYSSKTFIQVILMDPEDSLSAIYLLSNNSLYAENFVYVTNNQVEHLQTTTILSVVTSIGELSMNHYNYLVDNLVLQGYPITVPTDDMVYAYDSILAFAETLSNIIDKGSNNYTSSAVLDNMKSIDMIGASGRIRFDSVRGARISDFNIFCSNDTSEFSPCGKWEYSYGLSMNETYKITPPTNYQVSQTLLFGVMYPAGNQGPSALPQAYIATKIALRDLVASDPQIFGGRNWEVIYHDASLVPAKGLQYALSFVQRSPIVVIGTTPSSVAEQIALALSPFSVPQISSAASAAVLSDRVTYPMFMRTYPSDSYLASSMAYICNYYGWKQVAFVSSNDAYGQGGAETFLSVAASLNITVFTQTVVAINDANCTTQINAIKSSNIKVIITFTSTVWGALYKQAFAAGIMTPEYLWFTSGNMVNTASSYSQYLGSNSTKITEGLIGITSSFGIGTPNFKNVTKRILDDLYVEFAAEGYNATNTDYLLYASLCYDCAKVAGLGVSSVLKNGDDPKNGTSLYKEMIKVKTEGISGNINFDANGDRLGGGFIFQNYINGAWVTIGQYSHDDGFSLQEDAIFRGNTTVIPVDYPPICKVNGEFGVYNDTTFQWMCPPLPPTCQLGTHPVYSPSSRTYSCVECDAGSSTPTINTCTSCGTGTYSSNPGSLVCSGCEPGFYQNNTGSTKCLSCPVGSFSKLALQSSCEICGRGTYSDTESSSSCDFCPVGSYTPYNGSTSCIDCPESTTTKVPGSYSLEQCICINDYFLLNGKCVKCPTGGLCSGGNSTPLAMEGYWSNIDNPYNFLICGDNDGCKGVRDIGKCSNNFNGRVCSECSSGSYIDKEGVCSLCENNSKGSYGVILIFVVIGIVIVILITNWGNEQGQKGYTGIGTIAGILFNFAQVIAILSILNFSWSPPVVAILSFLQLSYVNLSFIASPKCAFSYNYYQLYIVRVLSPLIGIGIVIIAYLTIKLHTYLIRHFGAYEWLRRHYPDILIPPKTIFSIRTVKFQLGQMLCTPYINMDKNGVINSILMFADVLYVYLVSTGFEVFRCYNQPDGTKTLTSNPDIVCFSGDWWNLLPWSLLCMILWGLGIPIVFAIILYKFLRKRSSGFVDDKEELEWYEMFNYLVIRWVPKLQWWQLVIMLRKFLLSFIVTTFASTIDVQFVGVAFIFSASYLVQLKFKPYYTSIHNHLEERILRLYIVFLIGGLLLSIQFTRSATPVFVSWVLLTALVIAILLAIWSIHLLSKRFRTNIVHIETSTSSTQGDYHHSENTELSDLERTPGGVRRINVSNSHNS